MARKPARLERAGALTPRDRMWAAIRALGRTRSAQLPAAPFSAIEVQFLANAGAPEPMHVDSVLSYLEGLSKAQERYVTLVEGDRPQGRKRSELSLYTLTRDIGIDAPRVTSEGKPVTQGIGTERMWNAMRALREFDHAELAHAATDEQHAVSEETAKSYCIALCRAGYLFLRKPAVSGHAKARYRFNRAKNTGPRPPLITRNKEVMDGNTGAIVYRPGDAVIHRRDA